jgi:hypothetical protein
VVLQLGGWAWGSHLLTVKNKLVTEDHKKLQTWMDSLVKLPKRKKMDMRFDGKATREETTGKTKT